MDRSFFMAAVFASVIFATRRFATAKTVGNTTFLCAADKFKCNSQKCIPILWRCDGDNDCGDNSDEIHCLPSTCRPHYEFKCTSGKCIPKRWRCDGTAECVDRSDEENCDIKTTASPKKTCRPNFYKCRSTGNCIPKKWLCDGHNDCGNNDDESNCKGLNPTCKESYFKCGDNKCISKYWLCDKEFDCDDKSDEKGCTYENNKGGVCTSSEFSCSDSKKCLPERQKCDGKNDCMDGSDEKNCKKNGTACEENFWQCDDGSCIKSKWKCDGSKDCFDGSDEKSCSSVSCDSLEYACKNNIECISKNKKCDGEKHCSDGSDEDDCETAVTTPVACTPDMFKCRNGKCLPLEKVCDTIPDCDFYEDEPITCGLNECNLFNGHCSHNCTDLKIGYECSCEKGYQLALDFHTCEDVNECLLYGSCHQKCINFKGGYECSCVDGYILETDKKSCRVVGPDYWIYFANRFEIRKVSPDGSLYDVAVNGLEGVVSFDFNLAKEQIYMTDIMSETIKVATLGQPDSVKTLISNVHTPDGLAVDWVTGKLYWTDAGYKTIEVADLDGKNNADIVNVGLAHPRAISLDPIQGFIYWSDWGASAAIERISMDGDVSTRKVIVTGDIVWPNGMSLDLTQGKIYWIDAKLRKLEVVDMDGTNRRIIRETGIIHPFSLDNFEDQLYYTDWSLRGVKKVSKFQESNIINLKMNLTAPMDIKVMHVSRQPAGSNPCSGNNYGCSHLCLLGNKNGNRTVSCKCPRNMTLIGGKKCIGAPVTRPPRTKLHSTPPTPTDAPFGQSTKDIIKTDAQPNTMKPTASKSATMKKKMTPSVSVGSSKVQKAEKGMSAGVIFAIAISIIIGLVIVVLAIYYLKRRHGSKTQVLYYKDMSTAPLEDDFYTGHYDESDEAKIVSDGQM